jgi:hypothetical protein
LITASGGRVIVRDSASAFLDDLQGRITVFAQHPSGLTPDAVHAETLALARAKDKVGLDELLRRERYDYAAGVRDLHSATAQIVPAPESFTELEPWKKRSSSWKTPARPTSGPHASPGACSTRHSSSDC